MTRFQTLIAAAALLLAAPAFAHTGVHIADSYARTNGGIGATGAIFLEIENHADTDDRLIGVASDVAEKVELHTHNASADGVMQMRALAEGIPVPALQGLSLRRGGNHIMLMGLTRDLKDGDVIRVTLTFEHAGAVVVEVPVDNARKPAATGPDATGPDATGPDAQDMGDMHGAMDPTGQGAPKGHDMAAMHNTPMMADPEAITAALQVQFDTPEPPLSVDPVVVADDNALASWVQGDKAGRALLARRDGKWQIVLLAGAELRLPEFLSQHGVMAAEPLSQRFNAAEDKLGADKVALFSAFAGVAVIAPASE